MREEGNDMTDRLDKFTTGYVEAMLWLVTDEDGDSLPDLLFDDVSPESLKAIVDDCTDFQLDNRDALSDYAALGFDSLAAGHDFFLTRNRHGAGFWDRDYSPEGQRVGRLLTDAAHTYGETYEYHNDDGKVDSD